MLEAVGASDGETEADEVDDPVGENDRGFVADHVRDARVTECDLVGKADCVTVADPAVREVVRVTVNDAEREDDSGRVGVFVSLGESESDGV